MFFGAVRWYGLQFLCVTYKVCCKNFDSFHVENVQCLARNFKVKFVFFLFVESFGL